MIYILPMLLSAAATLRLSTRKLWVLVGIGLVFLMFTYHDQWWGLYHYHVGSKYFRELGYFDLYECTLDALDAQGPRRDLMTYEFRFGASDCQANFSRERWETFQADLDQDTDFYLGVMRDKGLNATPTWIALGEVLANLPQLTLISLDPAVLLLALVFAGYHLGWRKAAYAGLFILLFYGTVDRFTGHMGQWWWLAAVIVGVTLLEKRKAWGGFWIGIAATLAVFPIFLLMGRSRRVLTQGMMGLLVGGVIGLFTSRGLDVYPEFLQNMMLHSQHIRYEPFNIGLFNTLSMAGSPQMMGDWLECFRGGVCQVDYDFLSPWIGWLLLLPLVLNSRLGAMFGLLTLSRYYYLVMVVIPLTENEKRVRLLFAVNALLTLWIIVDREAAYRWGHFLWLGYFASYWVDGRFVPRNFGVLARTFTRKLAILK